MPGFRAKSERPSDPCAATGDPDRLQRSLLTVWRRYTFEIVVPSDATHVNRSSIDPLRGAVRRLLGAERRLRRRSRKSPDELTYAQLLTLVVLARRPNRTARDIAEEAGLDPGSLTAVLDKLESIGAIERARNPTNQRAYLISLSGHGHDIVVPSMTSWVARWDQRLARFSDAELDVAAQVVAEIADVFDSAPRCGALDTGDD